MPRSRSPLEIAAGKLIAAIQKEWVAQAGEPEAPHSEQVMDLAHELLQVACREGNLTAALLGQNLADYLGAAWVQDHPAVLPHIARLQALCQPSTHC